MVVYLKNIFLIFDARSARKESERSGKPIIECMFDKADILSNKGKSLRSSRLFGEASTILLKKDLELVRAYHQSNGDNGVFQDSQHYARHYYELGEIRRIGADFGFAKELYELAIKCNDGDYSKKAQAAISHMFG
jgi:hypothetical protein